MSAEIYKMICEEPKYTVEELNKKLDQQVGDEMVSCIVKKGDNYIISMCNMEKYFFRNGDMAALSVLISECNGIQSVDIVGFGGGRGLLNISMGANSDYAYAAMNVFSKLGFKKVKS